VSPLPAWFTDTAAGPEPVSPQPEPGPVPPQPEPGPIPPYPAPPQPEPVPPPGPAPQPDPITPPVPPLQPSPPREPSPPIEPTPLGSVARAPSSRPAHRKPHPWRGVIEWVVILAVALIGAFVIRTFLVQAFFIPSDSMLPTLERHDRVLVNKLSYSLHPVHRGDIVVFTHSPGFDPKIKDLIKRVIGLPGDSVSAHNGRIYINGRQLEEPYLPAGTVTADFAPRQVPAHDYWVMGDNRGNSTDSRVFGPITNKQIVGRAFVLVWPLDHLHLL
jgi:signal peptidase I